MDGILSTAANGPPLPLALDHLVVAARTLDEGEDWLRSQLGCALAPGGAHAGFGTHNRLLRLGGRCYLELIAADPVQSPGAGLLFGLDADPVTAAMAAGPLLLHAVLGTVEPADMADVLPRMNYDPGVPTAMSRGDLNWLITLPPGRRPAGRGLLPTIIDWRKSTHPCDRLPDRGVVLTAVQFTGPAAVMARFPSLRNAGSMRPGPVVKLSVDPPPATAEAQSAEQMSRYTIRADFRVDGRTVTIESALPD